MNEFNQKLDLLLRVKRENAAIPWMKKQDQWIALLIQIDREGPKVNGVCNFAEKF